MRSFDSYLLAALHDWRTASSASYTALPCSAGTQLFSTFVTSAMFQSRSFSTTSGGATLGCLPAKEPVVTQCDYMQAWKVSRWKLFPMRFLWRKFALSASVISLDLMQYAVARMLKCNRAILILSLYRARCLRLWSAPYIAFSCSAGFQYLSTSPTSRGVSSAELLCLVEMERFHFAIAVIVRTGALIGGEAAELRRRRGQNGPRRPETARENPADFDSCRDPQ